MSLAQGERGVQLFLRGELGEAVRCFGVLVDDASAPAEARALALLNRAVARHSLELHRAAIRDCQAARQRDETCLAAALWEGKSLVALGRRDEALAVWLAATRRFGDVAVHVELRRLIAALSSASSPSSASATATDASVAPVAAAAAAAAATEPPPAPVPTSWPAPTLAPAPAPVPTPAVSPDDLVDRAFASSRRLAIQNGSGNVLVDKLVATGYLHCNSGQHDKALHIFDGVIESAPRVVGAYLGRGTALAMSGRVADSLADFSKAIELQPQLADAWKRRGQARSALGREAEALADMDKALSLTRDQDLYLQRGLVHYKLRNYKRALADFEESLTFDPTHKLAHSHRGLCLNVIGRSREAVAVHQRALELDPAFKEAYANLGQAYRELGDAERAAPHFERALALDGAYAHGHHLLALLHYGMGEHRRAITHFAAAFKHDASLVEAAQMAATAQLALGAHLLALAGFERCVRSKPDSVAFYLRELALYVHRHLDANVRSAALDLDRSLDAHFKEALCKRLHPATLHRYTPQGAYARDVPDVDQAARPSAAARRLLAATDPLGARVQYRCDGFLRNRRQLRQCGLAALEVAQTLRRWLLSEDGACAGAGEGDGGASGGGDGGGRGEERGWRHLFGIAVRYRQLSEPNDPVFWVDQLSPEAFADGFGSHTPLITGQTHVVRYYPHFKRCFGAMKQLMPAQCSLGASSEAAQLVAKAKSCGQLLALMRRDFFVATPCYSSLRKGVCYEGTRLTIQDAPPEGVEFSIRTPGTPARWAEYDAELAALFGELKRRGAAWLRRRERGGGGGGGGGGGDGEETEAQATATAATAADKDDEEARAVWRLVLQLAYYWWNMMPLSRGTAASGFAALLGMLLGLGWLVTEGTPPDTQIDWEAILTPRYEDFERSVGEAWLFRSLRSSELAAELPAVDATLPTLRDVLVALNWEGGGEEA